MNLIGVIERSLSENYWREAPIVAQLQPHLSGASSVLDLGAGSCKVAKVMTVKHRLLVVPVDIVNHNVTDLHLTLYDGRTLPFDDNTFDVTVLVFVLHHATNPVSLLREAIRVSRSKVIILEDAPKNALERLAWRTWDYALNHGVHKDIDVAHSSRTVDQWVDLLATLDVRPTSVQTFRSPFPVLWMYQHVLLLISVSFRRDAT